MDSIIKIGSLGIVGVLLAIQFKTTKPEFGIYIGFAISIYIFSFCVGQFEAVSSQILVMKKYLEGMDGYLGILLKAVGITYVCEFAAGVCKDGGFASLAGQIEIVGKLAVMFAGLPILFAVIEQIEAFM